MLGKRVNSIFSPFFGVWRQYSIDNTRVYNKKHLSILVETLEYSTRILIPCDFM